MIVVLTWSELLIGAVIGAVRHIEAITKHLPDRHGRPDERDGFGDHIEGTYGEMSAARALNVYWPATVNVFRKESDLLEGIEVRTRAPRDDYQLYVRRNEASDRNYVLVRGRAPRYDVVGWINGGTAKREEWLKDHGNREPAYFVPDDELYGLDLLRLGA